jgi:hypothetical protein
MVGGMEVGKVSIMEVLHVTITPSESATHECITICLGWRVKRSFCDACMLAEFLRMLVFDNTSNVDIRVALDTWKHKTCYCANSVNTKIDKRSNYESPCNSLIVQLIYVRDDTQSIPSSLHSLPPLIVLAHSI